MIHFTITNIYIIYYKSLIIFDVNYIKKKRKIIIILLFTY